MHSSLEEMIFCMCARLCDDDILVVRVKKKEEIFLSLPLFALIHFFSFSRERRKNFIYEISREKKVEKNNEKEQKTEQNLKTLLSLPHIRL